MEYLEDAVPYPLDLVLDYVNGSHDFWAHLFRRS
jgi:hypothetical protein